MSSKNLKKVTIFKDEVIQSKSSKVIRKRFLNDLALNINKFRSYAYDNIVQQVEKKGIKKNIKLFNQIKDFVYDDIKSKITLKLIKSDVQDAKLKNIEAIFPFADDAYEKSNQSISTIKPSKVFAFSDNIFSYKAPELKEKTTILSNSEFKISKSLYKNVAEERTITINNPEPEDENLTLFMTKMSNVINRQLNDIYAKYGSYKIVFG